MNLKIIIFSITLVACICIKLDIPYIYIYIYIYIFYSIYICALKNAHFKDNLVLRILIEKSIFVIWSKI